MKQAIWDKFCSRFSIPETSVQLFATNADGNVQGIAKELFSTYVFPFEVVSALLITAAMGAMVLAHHQRTTVRPTQRQLSINRFRGESLGSAAGLPGPGVYARHNAVDVPALLPDGTPAPTSVNASLEARGDMLDYKSFDLAEVNTQIEEEK